MNQASLEGDPHTNHLGGGTKGDSSDGVGSSIPPTPPQNKSKKVLAIILIVALILLAASGGLAAYFYLKSQPATPLPIQEPVSTIQDLESPTSTPDPTANWQTYTNDQLGISLKHPPSFSVQERITRFESPHVYIDNQPFEIPEVYGMAQITPIEISMHTADERTYQEIVESYADEFKPEGLVVTKLDNIEATSFQGTLDFLGWEMNSVLANAPGGVIYINFQKDKHISPTIFDQILSTFEFLDETSSTKKKGGKVTFNKLANTTFKTFTLTIPSGWVSNESKQSNISATFTVSKGKYKLDFYQTSAGGSFCEYSDWSGNGFNGQIINNTKHPFTEMNTNLGIFRYSLDDIQSDENQNTYKFCQKESNTEYYILPTIIGGISFQTPSSPDQATIEEMESIIQSINLEE